jgi:hypothetical protein
MFTAANLGSVWVKVDAKVGRYERWLFTARVETPGKTLKLAARNSERS